MGVDLCYHPINVPFIRLPSLISLTYIYINLGTTINCHLLYYRHMSIWNTCWALREREMSVLEIMKYLGSFKSPDSTTLVINVLCSVFLVQKRGLE